MPTTRKRTPRSREVSTLNQDEINWLFDLPKGKPTLRFFIRSKSKEIEKLWRDNRTDVLSWWVQNKPCTRPTAWWKYDSARQVISDFPPDVWNFPAVRQRLGGIGTPAYEVLNVVPSFCLGLPDNWDSFGSERVIAIDPDNPPLYESQAAYLQLHGLLTTAEKAHLKKHPDLLQPEAVIFTAVG